MAFTDLEINPSTGSISVRGVFANPEPPGGVRLLTPGMFVWIRFPIGEPHPALLVIDRAIGFDRGQSLFDNFPQAWPFAGANEALVLSLFFIDRPIFATVLSILIALIGAVALATLPIAQYPRITPPARRRSLPRRGPRPPSCGFATLLAWSSAPRTTICPVCSTAGRRWALSSTNCRAPTPWTWPGGSAPRWRN